MRPIVDAEPDVFHLLADLGTAAGLLATELAGRAAGLAHRQGGLKADLFRAILQAGQESAFDVRIAAAAANGREVAERFDFLLGTVLLTFDIGRRGDRRVVGVQIRRVSDGSSGGRGSSPGQSMPRRLRMRVSRLQPAFTRPVSPRNCGKVCLGQHFCSPTTMVAGPDVFTAGGGVPGGSAGAVGADAAPARSEHQEAHRRPPAYGLHRTSPIDRPRAGTYSIDTSSRPSVKL